jgi:hypothetical protein
MFEVVLGVVGVVISIAVLIVLIFVLFYLMTPKEDWDPRKGPPPDDDHDEG